MYRTTIESPMSLGAVIRSRRRGLGMTQQELCDRLGLRQPYLSGIENGRVQAQIGTILSLLDALGLSLVAEERRAAPKDGLLDDIVG